MRRRASQATDLFISGRDDTPLPGTGCAWRNQIDKWKQSMSSHTCQPWEIIPEDRWSFFDRLSYRIPKRWLTEPRRFFLEEHCANLTCVTGRPIRRGSHRDKVNLLSILRPSAEAMEFIQREADSLLNYVELKVELCYQDEYKREAVDSFLRFALVKNYHRKQKTARASDWNFYTGSRRAPNIITIYSDRPSKLTGQPYCVALEWRAQGVRAVDRLHRYCRNSLADFDHHKSWSENLHLFIVDAKRLGKGYWRKFGRKRPKPVKHGNFYYDPDRRVGGTLLLNFAPQELIDNLSRYFPVRYYLCKVDKSNLLAFPSTYDYM